MSSRSKSKVYFFSKGVSLFLQNRNSLKKFIELLFRKEGKSIKVVNFIFCSDPYLLSINRKYLKHNYYTDIISFDLTEPNSPIEADIYISIDRIRANAKKYSNTFKSELHRVLFHGGLHLCGYDDKITSDKKLMRRREDYYLSTYFK